MEPIQRAEVLIEALPYIKQYHGKTVVVKYGGNAMINDELKLKVMQDIVLMKHVGINVVIVHGGGPEITAMMKLLGKEPDWVHGLRVTDAETMAIAEMVLVGKINPAIVALINHLGGKAVGLSGKDGGMVRAHKRLVRKTIDGREETFDIGFVGDVDRVDPTVIKAVSNAGYIPVIAPVGAGENNESYNINADYVAGDVAGALGADKLLMLTDVEGVFRDYTDKSTLITAMTGTEAEELIAGGIISGGMIPKVQACMNAIDKGVKKVNIIDGRLPHAILLELFTKQGIGTEIAG
ncbi:MAG TPA: acetylglutamate kinase [Firmicutes bacterium]|nr:acetylglutamate kinase [Bacillota bacterium]HWR55600.1 acetylglutamate kinase [Negativicutes bacterium]